MVVDGGGKAKSLDSSVLPEPKVVDPMQLSKELTSAFCCLAPPKLGPTQQMSTHLASNTGELDFPLRKFSVGLLRCPPAKG